MNNTIIMNYFLFYANYASNKPHSVKITPFSSTQVFPVFLASLGAAYFCCLKISCHNKYFNSKMDKWCISECCLLHRLNSQMMLI